MFLDAMCELKRVLIMAAKVSLVSVTQSPGGLAVGTFDLKRDGLQDERFKQHFPGNASAAEIGKALVERCYQIMASETVPAVSLIESMFAAGPRVIADPNAPPAEAAAA